MTDCHGGPVALTRSCRLEDFPDCHSVAEWQQAMVDATVDRWQPQTSAFGQVLCVNWSGCPFIAPGAGPIYRTDALGVLRPTDQLAVMIGLSVLDRIDAPMRFLNQHGQRLLPGGLFILTFALWNSEGEDCAIGHEVRRRIYNRASWLKLLGEAKRLDLRVWGEIDWTYHGHTLGDHTLAITVLQKGPGR
jgi:hypothetical protein